MRSLTVSGGTITSSITETEGLSYEEAEKKKIEEGMNLPACVSSIESLNTEIQNSIDYWRFTQKGPEVSELYICGKSSLLKGLKEFIQEKSRIKTDYFSPEEIGRIREFKLNRPYIYLSIIMAGVISITPVLFLTQDRVMLRSILNEIEISLYFE